MAVDSLKKRYFYKLSTNLLNFFISFITAGIVPRALGVQSYGNYSYIYNFFTQVLTFSDFRTSTCYFVKLSQDQKDRKITLFYFVYCLFLLSALSLVALIFISIQPLNHLIFADNSVSGLIIFLIFLFVFFSWFSDIISSSLDALGFTVYLEKVRMVNRVIIALLVLSLFYFNKLNINSFVILQLLLAILVISLLGLFLIRKTSFIKAHLSKTEFIDYSKIFYKYSYPLLGYMVLQFVGNTFDRWYLQREGGSFQQGVYSFAYALMNFSYIFINSIQPLVIREFSIATSENDQEKISRLFVKFNAILFAITAYLCAFIFIEAPRIVQFFGGNQYTDSINILRILIIYPLISSYSLLNGAVIYTTERTKLFLKLSSILTPLGIIITLLLINSHWGLSMGAKGLAIKSIIVDFISVIIILYINSKYLKFGFVKTVSHFLIFFVFLFVAFVSDSILLTVNMNYFIELIISGMIYSTFIIILLLFLPRYLGLDKEIPILIKTKLHEFYNKWISPSKAN